MGDRESGAPAFVLLCWGLCAGSIVALAWSSAAETPLWDDWANVPVLTGNRPLTLDWLWSQHNEHRIPLPRVIILGLARLTGGSFRAQTILNAIALAIGAGAALLAVRRLRGWTSYADAFLPLLLCGPTHERNVLVGFQIQLIASTVLYAMALAMIARSPRGLGTLGSALMAGVVALLPLCGANGVAFVPALALAMIAQGVIDRREAPRRSAILIAGAVGGLVLVVAYFRGWKSSGHSEGGASIVERLRITLQFLSNGWGVSAAETWPWSGWVEAIVVIAGLVALGIGWRREPGSRIRTAWLVAATAAMGSLALGVGSGRAGMGDRVGFETRYTTLAAPALAIAYLSMTVAGPSVARFPQMVLLALACATTWPNARAMIDAGRRNQLETARLAADIASGLPPYRMIARQVGFLHNSHDELTAGLPMLKRARMGLYANLVEDPPFLKEPLPVEASLLKDMTGRAGHYRGSTVDPYLIYDLPAPRYVAGVRLRYRHANARGLPGRFILAWRLEGDKPSEPTGRHPIWVLPTGDDQTLTVWINARISRLIIQPDNKPCEFDVLELSILNPDESSSPRR